MLSLDGRTAERPALAGRPRLSPRSAHDLAERALGLFGRVTGLACRARETNGARDLCEKRIQARRPVRRSRRPQIRQTVGVRRQRRPGPGGCARRLRPCGGTPEAAALRQRSRARVAQAAAACGFLLGMPSVLQAASARSLNARGALEAAPRGDTSSDCLIFADSSPIPQIRT